MKEKNEEGTGAGGAGVEVGAVGGKAGRLRNDKPKVRSKKCQQSFQLRARKWRRKMRKILKSTSFSKNVNADLINQSRTVIHP